MPVNGFATDAFPPHHAAVVVGDRAVPAIAPIDDRDGGGGWRMLLRAGAVWSMQRRRRLPNHREVR